MSGVWERDREKEHVRFFFNYIYIYILILINGKENIYISTKKSFLFAFIFFYCWLSIFVTQYSIVGISCLLSINFVVFLTKYWQFDLSFPFFLNLP